ncbi:MAG: flavin reductase family protein [Clostridia bacterium]|nr:flavin reductase family protein [Clostridia bacterium]
MKQTWQPATLLAPVPVVMASCGTMKHHNIITIAWTGIVNSNPAMTYISVRPGRHSYNMIKESGEFVINLVTRELVRKTDQCGVYTGSKVNKFKSFGLTPEKATKVSAPMIKESPVNLECRVTQVIPLGTHDMFLAEILAVNVDEKLIDETGKLCMKKANLVAYSHGDYLELGRKAGKFGFSVKKKNMKP